MSAISSESMNPDSALEQARYLDTREIPCTTDTDIIYQQVATEPCETSQIEASTLTQQCSQGAYSESETIDSGLL